MVTNTELRFSDDWARTLSDVCGAYDNILILTSAGGRERGTETVALSELGNDRTTVLPHAPSYPSVEALCELYGSLDFSEYDAVVAIGGGSVIDSAKSIVLARGLDSNESLEGQLAAGAEITRPSDLHLIAIPTTAGSGSEVTPFATIWNLEASRKASISGPGLQPRVAIVDSSLLQSLKSDDLLYPALDAVSHAIESLWSRRSTSDSALCAATSLSALSLALGSCVSDTPDLKRLSLGSVYAGLAIADSRTALAHAISYPLTLKFQVPHGLACSFTLNAIHCRLKAEVGPYSSYIAWIDEALSQVERLRLSQRVQKFVSLPEALEIVDEMFTPGRGDNFIVHWNEKDVIDILTEAYTS